MKTPTSVMVLSIIGIIFGVLGMCGIFSIFALAMPSAPGDPMAELKKDSGYIMLTTISAVVGFFVSILLLVSSINAIRLKKLARSGMILYAWLAIAQAIAGTIINVTYTFPRLSATLPPGSPMAGMMPAMQIGIMCGSLLVLVYPICILYFFSRPHVIDAFNGIFRGPTAGFPVNTPAASPSTSQDPIFP